MRTLLYLANLRLPTEKAYGIQIAKMCEAFANRNLDVILVHPFRRNTIEEDFFTYYSVKRIFKITELWAQDFSETRLEYINIFLTTIKNFLSAIILAVYALLLKKSDIIFSRDELIILFFLIFSNRYLIYEPHRFSRRRKLFYWIFNKYNIKISAITENLRDDFIDIGFKRENILIAPDGVNTDEFSIDISQREARSRIQLPLDKKIVMYAGHLFEWKGVDVLLEVARSYNLQPTTYNLLFVFVGGMPYDVKKFKKKAEGLENILILGHKPYGDIPYYLKSADVLILPNSGKEEISKYYTSPLKLFEYMASGQPIIASNLPSITEILNEENSVLVKPDDYKELAKGISKLFNDPFLGDKLAKKARENVEKYTWDKRAKKLINFIQQ